MPADVIEAWIQHPNQRFMAVPHIGYLAGNTRRIFAGDLTPGMSG